MNSWSSATPYNLVTMTDEEIIEYIVKGKEDPRESIEDETADLDAMENEGIEFIGKRFQNERHKSLHTKS